MAMSKGAIVGIVLGVLFVMLIGMAGIGFVGWRYYQSHMARKMASMMETPTPVPPESGTTNAPGTDATTEPTTDATSAPTAEATTEPTTEPTMAPLEETSAPVRTKGPAKKAKPATTLPPATPEPKATDEPERRPAPPKVQMLEISHVHGGFSKKACTGTLQLLDTGFKYDANTSEDDRQDHVEVRFDQVKKVEMKDPKTVEVSTTDKKWTFRGDGLVVSKLSTHLNTHSKQFAGK
jgi:hypothetical protein